MAQKKRGRPRGSKIRDRTEEVVDALGVAYGYEIQKVYRDAFGPVGLRTIYYHLNRGLLQGIFECIGAKAVKGAYTWGDTSMRKYYISGPVASKTASDSLHIIVNTLGLAYKDPSKFVDWLVVFNKALERLRAKKQALEDKKSKGAVVQFDEFQSEVNEVAAWFSGRVLEEKIVILRKLSEARTF